MKLIEDKGYFAYIVSILLSGEESYIRDMRMLARTEIAKDVFDDLAAVGSTGFARTSRRGWKTLEHPDLGMVQWKCGVDFRTKGNFYILRVNGRQVLYCWPKAGENVVHPRWTQNPAQSNLLGSLRW